MGEEEIKGYEFLSDFGKKFIKTDVGKETWEGCNHRHMILAHKIFVFENMAIIIAKQEAAIKALKDTISDAVKGGANV